MIKNFALAGLFAVVSLVSYSGVLNASSGQTSVRRSDSRPLMTSPTMRGGPCLPGIPKC